MIRRLLVSLLAIISGLAFGQFGLTTTAVTASATITAMPSYSYDGHHVAVRHPHATTERGPPKDYQTPITTHKAVDRWSHGPSARPEATAPGTATTYDSASPLVQVARVTPTFQEQAQVTDGHFVVFDRAGVAAKTASGAGGDLTTLYRAVEPGELKDIMGTGAYRSAPRHGREVLLPDEGLGGGLLPNDGKDGQRAPLHHFRVYPDVDAARGRDHPSGRRGHRVLHPGQPAAVLQ